MSLGDSISDWMKSRFSLNKITDNEKEDVENEDLPSLPLQMATYFNMYFYPIWAAVMIIFLHDHIGDFEMIMRVLTITILTIALIIDLLKCYMLYEGNLYGKIPELAGSCMLAVFLQLPIQGFLLFSPMFQLRVLQVCCQGVMFILLIFQTIFGYATLRRMVQKQAKLYRNSKDR